MARFSLRKLLRKDRGAAVLEFGLVAPLLFLIIYAIIAFGRGYARLNVLTGALRHGGRVASTVVTTCTTSEQDFVKAAVEQHSTAFGAPVDTSQVDVVCGSGDVSVSVDGYPLFNGIDFFGMDGLSVTRTAVFRRER